MEETNQLEQQKKERVFQLTQELLHMEREKKESAAGFREELSRIKKEIADIIKGDENGA